MTELSELAPNPSLSAMYRHTQTNQLIRLVIAFSAVAGYVGFAAATSWLIAVPFLAVLLWAAIVFSSLTIVVTEDTLTWHFGSGFWRKTVPLTSIVAAYPVRNRWWYGWGIRLTPHGWLYNVSGLQAVEVKTSDGKTVRLGTDEPEALVVALQGQKSA